MEALHYPKHLESVRPGLIVYVKPDDIPSLCDQNVDPAEMYTAAVIVETHTLDGKRGIGYVDLDTFTKEGRAFVNPVDPKNLGELFETQSDATLAGILDVSNGKTLCIACHGKVHGKDFTNRKARFCIKCHAKTKGRSKTRLCRSCAISISHAHASFLPGQMSLLFPKE